MTILKRRPKILLTSVTSKLNLKDLMLKTLLHHWKLKGLVCKRFQSQMHQMDIVKMNLHQKNKPKWKPMEMWSRAMKTYKYLIRWKKYMETKERDEYDGFGEMVAINISSLKTEYSRITVQQQITNIMFDARRCRLSQSSATPVSWPSSWVNLCENSTAKDRRIESSTNYHKRDKLFQSNRRRYKYLKRTFFISFSKHWINSY